MFLYAAAGAAIVIAALSGWCWVQGARLEAKDAQISGLELSLKDAGQKIVQQNRAVDKWAADAELAKAERDRAIAAGRADVALHGGRARDIRTALVEAPKAPGARSADKAVAEVRKRLAAP